MIQIVTRDSDLDVYSVNNKQVFISNYSNYESFDKFEVNIIDLNCDCIWYNDSSYINSLNMKDDIIPLNSAINSCDNKVLILMPNNYKYSYSKTYSGNYAKQIELKSITKDIKEILNVYLFNGIEKMTYEKNDIKIDKLTYNSDFYFSSIDDKNILLRFDNKKKISTYSINNVTISTLNIFDKGKKTKNTNKLENFLNFLYGEKTKLPEWINNVYILDDKEKLEKIKENEERIKELENEIENYNNRLQENNKIKSILYETGDNLKDEIINILEDILQEKNDFVDVHEEDYNFKYGNVTYIVEVKGVTGPISGKDISNAFYHKVIYDDKLDQEGKEEDTKCIFIVASEREINICDRSKINLRNETFAKNNKILIIDTPSFLNIYEDFLNKKIDKEEIMKIFKTQNGLIKYERK